MKNSKKIPVDKDAWSQKSKDGLDYEFFPEFYSDIEYKCEYCKTDTIFSAEDQKYTYEVRKATTWQTRRLCTQCHKERIRIEGEIIAINSEWSSRKQELKTDPGFLRRWLFLLTELPEYGGTPNSAHIKMLEKLLEDAT